MDPGALRDVAPNQLSSLVTLLYCSKDGSLGQTSRARVYSDRSILDDRSKAIHIGASSVCQEMGNPPGLPSAGDTMKSL
jgi:hypothetical protein